MQKRQLPLSKQFRDRNDEDVPVIIEVVGKTPLRQILVLDSQRFPDAQHPAVIAQPFPAIVGHYSGDMFKPASTHIEPEQEVIIHGASVLLVEKPKTLIAFPLDEDGRMVDPHLLPDARMIAREYKVGTPILP